MPVTREQRRFGQIGPIGVARLQAPVPGSNASGIIAESVGRAADQMADMFFRRGVQLAEKAGTEAGIAAQPESIMTIDPVTGAPKAFEPPPGMGIVAQEAYQRVITTRFQSSIEQEIKFKAQELAIKYDGSVDRYSAAMSEYIGAMASTAQGQFAGYIVDVGTSYLNATRSAMALNQVKRERSAAAKAAMDASVDGWYSAVDLFAADFGPYFMGVAGGD
jgi:hypothetical protein